MAEIETHAFDPKPEIAARDYVMCPICGQADEVLDYIEELEIPLVRGNHSYQVTVYQCPSCERIVVDVVDFFND